MTPPSAAVVICTRDRRDEVRRAIASALAQNVACPVLVIDDASTDGTGGMVASEFPGVTLVRRGRAEGPLEARNLGARLAREGGAEIVFGLDDDAVFSTHRVVEQTLARFDHERVAAVAIPLVNFLGRERVDPDRFDEVCPGEFTVTFAMRAGACAMRAGVFLGLGGYKGFGIYGEESHLAARLLDAGYVTRGGGGIDPVHHSPSPTRVPRLITRQKAINNLLLAWHLAPLPEMAVHVAGVWVNMLRHGAGCGHLGAAAGGLLRGTWRSVASLRERRAISHRTYRLMRRLIRAGCVRFEEIEGSLGVLRKV